MRTVRRGPAVLVAALAVASIGLGVVLVGAPPASGSTGPTVQLSPSVGAPGTEVLVTASGLPPGIVVQAQLCGNDALNGTVDCATSNSGPAATTSSGGAELRLSVVPPPKPCPCVVMVTGEGVLTEPTARFVIPGFPTAPATSSRSLEEPLRVTRAELSGDGPAAAWIGGAPQRTLTVTVENPASSVYPDPLLVIRVGSVGSPGPVVASKLLANFRPGEQRTLSVPVDFPVVATGEYEVAASVGSPGSGTRFVVRTWIFPVGLFVIAFLLLQVVALAITGAVRRRRLPPATPEEAGATPDARTGEPVAVGAGTGAGREAVAGSSPPA